MDEIIEINEEFEAIRKNLCSRFSEPVAYLGDLRINFNTAAKQLVPDRIEWFVSSNYVIGIPSKSVTKGYSTFKPNKRASVCSTAFPSELKNAKKVKNGYYKLYKYKDGFAFKRYEPLEVQ